MSIKKLLDEIHINDAFEYLLVRVRIGVKRPKNMKFSNLFDWNNVDLANLRIIKGNAGRQSIDDKDCRNQYCLF